MKAKRLTVHVQPLFRAVCLLATTIAASSSSAKSSYVPEYERLLRLAEGAVGLGPAGKDAPRGSHAADELIEGAKTHQKYYHENERLPPDWENRVRRVEIMSQLIVAEEMAVDGHASQAMKRFANSMAEARKIGFQIPTARLRAFGNHLKSARRIEADWHADEARGHAQDFVGRAKRALKTGENRDAIWAADRALSILAEGKGKTLTDLRLGRTAARLVGRGAAGLTRERLRGAREFAKRLKELRSQQGLTNQAQPVYMSTNEVARFAGITTKSVDSAPTSANVSVQVPIPDSDVGKLVDSALTSADESVAAFEKTRSGAPKYALQLRRAVHRLAGQVAAKAARTQLYDYPKFGATQQARLTDKIAPKKAAADVQRAVAEYAQAGPVPGHVIRLQNRLARVTAAADRRQVIRHRPPSANSYVRAANEVSTP